MSSSPTLETDFFFPLVFLSYKKLLTIILRLRVLMLALIRAVLICVHFRELISKD